MNEAAANREVEALIQGYLDGSLTEPESGRLLSFLRREPALAIVIVEGLRADYLIRSVAERSLAATSAALENVIPMPTEGNDPRILRAPSAPEPERWSAGLRHGEFEDVRSTTPGRRPALLSQGGEAETR